MHVTLSVVKLKAGNRLVVYNLETITYQMDREYVWWWCWEIEMVASDSTFEAILKEIILLCNMLVLWLVVFGLVMS